MQLVLRFRLFFSVFRVFCGFNGGGTGRVLLNLEVAKNTEWTFGLVDGSFDLGFGVVAEVG